MFAIFWRRHLVVFHKINNKDSFIQNKYLILLKKTIYYCTKRYVYRPIRVITFSTCNGVTEENLRKFLDSKWKQDSKEKQETHVKRILHSDIILPR